jgi:hypothetical protein
MGEVYECNKYYMIFSGDCPLAFEYDDLVVWSDTESESESEEMNWRKLEDDNEWANSIIELSEVE